MTKKRSGICVAGNMIVDIVYPIHGWPEEGELTTITQGISRSTGGAVCNTIIDLAKLDGELPLQALGVIGTDVEGDFILEKVGEHKNIDISQVKRQGITSFTTVMSNSINQKRTFFHYRGANAVFDESYIEWENINAEILHIGYILLLDALDQEDDKFGTKMARLLHNAQQYGIKTSIDVVSETGNRFIKLVPPALKYSDHCIINELEAQQTTNIQLRSENDELITDNIYWALRKMMDMGVSTWTIIHAPEGGFGLDQEGNFVALNSLNLPKGYIKDTLGAGDAFCAGVLYAVQKRKCLREAIEMGIASATCSLSQCGATEGMRNTNEAMDLYARLRKF
jgi:sugar/nucleoside kinase (ribokinase family)